MCSIYHPDGADTQDLRRAATEKNEVEKIADRRKQVGAPWPYRVLTILTTAAALVMWGFIYADVAHHPGAPIDRAYGTLLTLAALVGFSAVTTGLVWLREHDASRHRSEADRIREQQHIREVKSIKEAIGVFLRDGDEDTRKLMTQTQQLINGTGTEGNVHPFRGRN